MPISLDWLRPKFPDLVGIERLNAGGQKEVFAATHPADGAVVLKIIYPRTDPEAVQRELLAAQQVGPNRVPAILAFGQFTTPLGECFWFREKRILGESLRNTVDARALAHVDLVRLALHMLEALVRAEAVRIVHRDVKPDNIICDQSGNYWLLDFGIARHLDLVSLTATAHRFGKFTLGYAPPEQFRNIKREIDSRSDLFALAVTLYECATRTNPFRVGARSDLEVIRRVEQLPLPRLALTCKAADEFSDLICSMAQKHREHRPSGASEAFDWIASIAEQNGIT